MPVFKFYHPIEVRYGDLDPQGHVNNSRYLTYMEQGRIAYVFSLGLASENASFLDLGMILADVHITFRSPIQYRQAVRVGVRVSRLGNKSLTMEHSIEDSQTGEILASGESVLVAYDYRRSASMPIPDAWRQAISAYESIPVA